MHISYGEYEATVDIKTGKVTGDFPKRGIKFVLEWLEKNRSAALREWEKMEKTSSPNQSSRMAENCR
ncbi:MAG: DUF4160 domain-containing protein [Chlamydiales bacterium]|nr:DUF4160 domain-containing protein [Chlamydiales bacterium]